jgi:uncharacterized membrane protein
MNVYANTSTILNTNKFGKLSLVDKGLIAVNYKKEESVFLFSEIEKIYIKKSTFNLFDKIVFLAILSFLLLIIAIYWQVEIAFTAFILSLLLLVKANNYKRYRLCVMQNNTIFCLKVFYQDNKQEYLNLISTVRKEMYYHQINAPIQFKIVKDCGAAAEGYSFPSIGIA